MKTYDQNGRLLGSGASDSWGSSDNSLTPIDVTAQYLPYYDPNAPAGSQVLPTINVSAPSGTPWYDGLLKPPTVYWVVAGLALLAWGMDKKRR